MHRLSALQIAEGLYLFIFTRMLIANVVAGWLSMNGTVGGIPWGASLANKCDKQVCFNINAAIA